MLRLSTDAKVPAWRREQAILDFHGTCHRMHDNPDRTVTLRRRRGSHRHAWHRGIHGRAHRIASMSFRWPNVEELATGTVESDSVLRIRYVHGIVSAASLVPECGGYRGKFRGHTMVHTSK